MRGRKGDYKEQHVAGGRWQVAGCLRSSGQSQHTVHALTVNSCGQDTTGRERGEGSSEWSSDGGQHSKPFSQWRRTEGGC